MLEKDAGELRYDQMMTIKPGQEILVGSISLNGYL